MTEPTSEQVDLLIAQVAQLNNGIGESNTQIAASNDRISESNLAIASLSEHAQHQKRFNRILVIAAIVGALLLAGVVVSVAQAHHASRVAQRSAKAAKVLADQNKQGAIDLCNANNKTRADALHLWFGVTMTPDGVVLAPEVQANIDRIRALASSTYAQRPC